VSGCNARLTVRARWLVIERTRLGWSQATVAGSMDVSQQCVQRWVTRYRTEGEAELEDRSSRPFSMPTKTSEDAETAVLALRQTTQRPWSGGGNGATRDGPAHRVTDPDPP